MDWLAYSPPAMVENSLLLFAITGGLIFLFIHALSYFQDVPDLYLQEQSMIEPTRLLNESPVYHSNKLSGLRVGLDIRYDSYKSRSGNLNDIWEITTKLSKEFDKGILVNDEKLSISYINYCIANVELSHNKTILIPKNHEINAKWIMTVLIGFVKQLTLEFYIDLPLKTTDAVHISDIKLPQEKAKRFFEFKNVYTPEKDKGIAIRLHNHISHAIDSIVEFTQLNIVSAVASTLKHLPNSDDFYGAKMTIISCNGSNESINNVIVKMLTGFLLYSEIIITDRVSAINNKDSDDSSSLANSSSIVSIPESQLLKVFSGSSPDSIPQLLQRYLLTRGVFPYKSNRLIYIYNSLNMKSALSYYELNSLRMRYKTRVIKELDYYNVMGPVILTDFYDYRQFDKVTFTKFGCVFQSLEIKLNNLLKANWGNLMVRGYTIGKTTNVVNGELDNVASKDNEGFMPINIVKGKWGSDGCLYIM
ncbi:hypothetical protein Cantr_00495 [Candida viswanathii]|uniref:Uncharacterized protein n=1 Tax=Candida viswanathii TaxID=5486 RepID=A0A367YGQ1_9ASCO|nr:hypothetical protein Cantr_00495 [Candida viswanathii]